MHGPTGEQCAHLGAHLHSGMLFVLLFHYVLCVRDAFSQRGKGVAGYLPPPPAKQLQLCPRAILEEDVGCLPGVVYPQ